MAATRSGTKRLLRELNRHQVLRHIAENGPLSRTTLAREARLPASTITHIVADFVASGLVTEEPTQRPVAGRAPVMLDLNPSAGHLVGVKVRDDDLTVVVCDLRCQIVHSVEASLPTDGDPHVAVAWLAGAVEEALGESGVARSTVLGVGVGVPARVDANRRRIAFSHVGGWQSLDLAAALETSLQAPVWIDNVVNTLAMGQRRFGAGRQTSDFLLVTIGRGVGMSAVLNGGLYRGHDGAANDFGHITMDFSPDAPQCNCGKRGCLEAIASDYAIVRTVIGSDPGSDVEGRIGAIVDAARAGDPSLRHLFVQAGRVLGIAIANLVNLYDPALLLLAGEGLRARDLFMSELLGVIPEHTPGHRATDLHIEVLDVDDRDWARGAASLVLHELLRPPLWETTVPMLLESLVNDSGREQFSASAAG